MEVFVAAGELTVSISVPDGRLALAQEALTFVNASAASRGGVDGFLQLDTVSPAQAHAEQARLAATHSIQYVDSRIRFFDPTLTQLRTLWIEGKVPSVAVKLELVQLMLTLLSDRSGLLIHAAGVGLGGQAIIVTGPSGAGKSTAAGLLNGHLLSDDMVVLTHLSERPLAHSTTFGGKSDGPVTLPLAAILFPRQARSFALRRLSAREAFIRYQHEHGSYLSHTLQPCRQRLALSALNLFERVPSFEMSFTRDSLDHQAIQEVVLQGVEGASRTDVTPGLLSESGGLGPGAGQLA